MLCLSPNDKSTLYFRYIHFLSLNLCYHATLNRSWRVYAYISSIPLAELNYGSHSFANGSLPCAPYQIRPHTHTHENLLLRTRDEKQVAIETRLECQIIWLEMVKKIGSAWGCYRNPFKMSNTLIRNVKKAWAGLSLDCFYGLK